MNKGESQRRARRLAKQGYGGLSARIIIIQSAMCHPDWSVEMHVSYLEAEEGVVVWPSDVDEVLAAEGLTPAS